MIPKIKKILYATDLSTNSAYAFRYAVNSAEKHDAQIDILHVFATPRFLSEADLSSLPHMYEEARVKQIEKIKNRLDAIVQRELKDNPDAIKRVTSIDVVEGPPASEILRKADELKSDLLIMGTHSKGIIAYTFLGSVARQVLERTRIPVFIIPLPLKTDIDFHD